jgi:hypothetical protein
VKQRILNGLGKKRKVGNAKLLKGKMVLAMELKVAYLWHKVEIT